MINLRNRNKKIEENCIQSLRDLCDTIWLTKYSLWESQKTERVFKKIVLMHMTDIASVYIILYKWTRKEIQPQRKWGKKKSQKSESPEFTELWRHSSSLVFSGMQFRNVRRRKTVSQITSGNMNYKFWEYIP